MEIIFVGSVTHLDNIFLLIAWKRTKHKSKFKHNTYLTKWLHSCVRNNHVKDNILSFHAKWREKKKMEHKKLEYFFHIAALMAAVAYS
jgi:hypothetical protein